MSISSNVPSGALTMQTDGRRIGRSDELGAGIRVLQLRHAVGDDDLRPADNAADRLVKEKVADHVLRQPIAAINLHPGGRGEMIQRSIRHADAIHAAHLHVGDEHGRAVGDPKPGSKLSGALKAPS